jgi:hypothetical protein
MNTQSLNPSSPKPIPTPQSPTQPPPPPPPPGRCVGPSAPTSVGGSRGGGGPLCLDGASVAASSASTSRPAADPLRIDATTPRRPWVPSAWTPRWPSVPSASTPPAPLPRRCTGRPAPPPRIWPPPLLLLVPQRAYSSAAGTTVPPCPVARHT